MDMNSNIKLWVFALILFIVIMLIIGVKRRMDKYGRREMS